MPTAKRPTILHRYLMVDSPDRSLTAIPTLWYGHGWAKSSAGRSGQPVEDQPGNQLGVEVGRLRRHAHAGGGQILDLVDPGRIEDEGDRTIGGHLPDQI